uniref:Uncharacterized protein n=1 Tax=Meloidogyne enterolobii TaxID=390850 RepID=A0A6V7ULD2_MELEN|nr:unnamed protein product [Meloidogyne enterolobii]
MKSFPWAWRTLNPSLWFKTRIFLNFLIGLPSSIITISENVTEGRPKGIVVVVVFLGILLH